MVLFALAAVLTRIDFPTVKVAGPETVHEAMEPQAAVSSDGKVYVVFGDKKSIYLSESTDRGKTFDEPKKVATPDSLMIGMRRGPRICLSNGSIVVTATSFGNLFAWRSSDDGATWNGPSRVNDKDGSAAEGLQGMAANDSEIVCAWLDRRDEGNEIFASVSEDGGENWSANTLVYNSPSGTVCECCHPSVAIGTDGAFHIMFRNNLAGNRDMYIADSTDDGQTWSSPVQLGGSHWKLDACPMDGGALSPADEGHLLSIWRRQDTVYTNVVGSTEDRIGVGEQPWIYGRLGGYGVYLKKRPGPLMEFHGSDAPRKIADEADDPVIAGPATGDGPVVAVWANPKGEILSKVLFDGE